MRYHFVVNGYTDDVQSQMEEQKGFAQKYLAGMEQKEAIIYCRNPEDVQKIQAHHAKEAVFIKSQEYVPEHILQVLCSQAGTEELYIFGSDDSGMELAVRMAARLLGSSVTEAEKLYLPVKGQENSGKNHGISVSKMVYANHMEGIFAMKRGPYGISLARGGERQELTPGRFRVKEEMICENQTGHILSQKFYPEASESSLGHAKVILAAGRGVKNKENMTVIDETAKCLGAEVAVSRPAAMNAWKPMNRLIGVSGAMVGPEICITAGVSGAAAFYAGIEKSKFIAAINIDEHAPIMKMADAAVIDDFLPVMEELKKICK